MAQYRLSAQMISRSQGRSAVAAAAYRSGSKLVDERTGEEHDFSRKRGVTHSEIILPPNTPDWMKDRAQLWNAVEKAETRKNSQLARELQLSLPHELTHEQRVELVRSFVTEHCVAKGMIADIAFHDPDTHEMADQRNYHAHIMLTTREFFGDQWAKIKNRDWHKKDLIEGWRFEWKEHQNAMLKRHGHSERVDHRSLEDQGIFREPQQHMGPIATEIERSGRASHRGNENRDIAARNGSYLDLETAEQKVAAKIAFERQKFAAWAEQKRSKLVLDQEQHGVRFRSYLEDRQAKLDESLETEFGQKRDALQREHSEVSSRLQSSWWRKFIAEITGRARRDREELGKIEEERARVKDDESRRRMAEQANQDRLKAQKAAEMARQQQKLQQGIAKAEQRRASEDWAMKAGKGVANDTSPADPKKPAPPTKAIEEARQQQLDEEKTTVGFTGQQHRDKAAKGVHDRSDPAHPTAKKLAPTRGSNFTREEAMFKGKRPGLYNDPDRYVPDAEKIKRAETARRLLQARKELKQGRTWMDDKKGRDDPDR